MRKLQLAMQSHAYSVADLVNVTTVNHQSLRNLIGGRVDPWDMKIFSVQQICAAFKPSELRVDDFYAPDVVCDERWKLQRELRQLRKE